MDEIKEESLDNQVEKDQETLLTKEEVFYVSNSPQGLHSQNIKCSNCINFKGSSDDLVEGSCQKVDGEISHQGFCHLYTKSTLLDTNPPSEDTLDLPPAIEDLSQMGSQEAPISLSNGFLKIPVAQKGRFFHEGHGIIKFDDEDFEQIKALSSVDVLGFTPYITYGHPKNLPYESVDAELKKGDLKGWEEEGDILFGLFDAKEDAYSYVLNKDYEYASGEFIRNYKDKFTGENKGTVLTRLALTNSPFLPFGDSKIEVLSTNSTEECLPSTIPFVIKLSIENVEVLQHSEEIKNTPINKLNMDQLENIDTSANLEDNVEPTLTTPVVVENGIVPTAPFDVTKLIESVTAPLTSSFQAQLESLETKYQAVVNGLEAKVSELTTKLTQQEQVTQYFSNTITEQNKQQFYKSLADQGVTPVLIQKFSLIESAVSSNQNVIKLSTGTPGEVQEKDLLASIAELLVDAVNSEPVQVQQFGQTLSKPQLSSLEAQLQQAIEANKAKANKLTV